MHRAALFRKLPWIALALACAGGPGVKLAPVTAPAAGPRPPAPFSVPALAPGGRRLLLVMVDGLPVPLFEETLAAGDLPRLQAILASRPSYRTTAIATFPSATSPSLPEMLSGSFAEMADAPAPGAVHAFDREARRVVRYFTQPEAWQWPVPDLFTAAAAAGLSAVTVAEGRWDGAETIPTRGPVLRDAALEVLGLEGYNGDRAPVEKLLRRFAGPSPPVVTLLVFNSVDLSGHFHGPGSPETRQALIATDGLIGEIVDALSEIRAPAGRTLFDDTTLILFGDHGMVPSGTFVNLQPYFKRYGLGAFDASALSQLVFRERLGTVWSRWPDVLLVAGGSNVTQIYLRRPSGGWEDRGPAPPRKAAKAMTVPPLATLAAEVAELPGISQVIRLLDDGSIEIRASGDRVAWVVRSGTGRSQRFAYAVAPGAGDDPLGYLADPAIAPRTCRRGEISDHCFLSRDEWLEMAVGARFPAAVPLLHKALHPERFTGDLVITSLPGFTFLRGQKGDHGNLERDAMLTPFLLNGPGIDPLARVPQVRLVDLYPTAAVLLGADPRDPALAGIDGRALPCALRPPAAGAAPPPPS